MDKNYLRNALSEWTDSDIACCHLAQAIGIFHSDITEEQIEKLDMFRKYKWVFATNNHMVNSLHDFLKSLVKLGLLEHDEEEMQFRWKVDYSIDANNHWPVIWHGVYRD